MDYNTLSPQQIQAQMDDLTRTLCQPSETLEKCFSRLIAEGNAPMTRLITSLEAAKQHESDASIIQKRSPKHRATLERMLQTTEGLMQDVIAQHRHANETEAAATARIAKAGDPAHAAYQTLYAHYREIKNSL